MLAYLLKPSNLLIAALVVLLGATWAGYQVKKTQLAKVSAELAICQRDVDGYKDELASADRVIEGLRRNLSSIRKQLDEWKKIALEAEGFAQRLLQAAEAKVSCEAYDEENARLVNEFVDGFNSSVRRKIQHPASAAGDRSTTSVLPKAGASDAH